MERAIATDPDVVLLDIGLPGMTGYELARKFAAHPIVSRAKLIALTGYGQPGDTEQAQAAGFAGYSSSRSTSSNCASGSRRYWPATPTGASG